MTTEVKKKGQEEVVNIGSTPITIYFKAAWLKVLQVDHDNMKACSSDHQEDCKMESLLPI